MDAGIRPNVNLRETSGGVGLRGRLIERFSDLRGGGLAVAGGLLCCALPRADTCTAERACTVYPILGIPVVYGSFYCGCCACFGVRRPPLKRCCQRAGIGNVHNLLQLLIDCPAHEECKMAFEECEQT